MLLLLVGEGLCYAGSGGGRQEVGLMRFYFPLASFPCFQSQLQDRAWQLSKGLKEATAIVRLGDCSRKGCKFRDPLGSQPCCFLLGFGISM